MRRAWWAGSPPASPYNRPARSRNRTWTERRSAPSRREHPRTTRRPTMNTENLSPGVYVRDVKPLGRPLTTPSLSTFGMFGRLSVDTPTNKLVAIESFAEYLQRHSAADRGPFGSLLLLRLALDMPW